MIKKITKDSLYVIRNQLFLRYAQLFTNIESNTLVNIKAFGLPLEHAQSSIEKTKLLTKLKNSGAHFRNNNKSIYINRFSSACEACQTGSDSYTTFLSMKCHRNCYFCFNENQDNYTHYLENQREATEELASLINNGYQLKHIALTGGEPLLFPNETIHFFQFAKKNSPESFTRLYTAGDLLTDDILKKLMEAGLKEIRFSIKMEDSTQKRKHILRKIKLAKSYIPNVLVEMPVIPGTLERMKELLIELDKLDIFGINLLEFCFPLKNPKPFIERGFELKNPPYEMYYNYWYAGGLAIAKSEEDCLKLIEFAIEQNLKLGVHYCSLENKFTGQIYQQNYDQKLEKTYSFSNRDYFFKTAKIFGKEKRKALFKLEENNIPYEINQQYDFIQFPVEAIKLLHDMNVEIAVVSCIVEFENMERLIKEVSIDWTTPALFQLEDVS
ncbi:radical SAM protein [Bacillus sp. FJAT-49705]|uniref:Radical SAM protein n=1 Tax=Cytobacillus citreus TaxID=2833586 RepID=A0ABS5NXA8_9BACI|nr:radical SAM protein [Cytobacillus citreus]MBS4191539.1 radical SAM protein [Cytobacillus citreus]